MYKIMFNDRYGLTQVVLDGRKTQTRRIARVSQHDFELLTGVYPNAPKELIESILKSKSRYKVGEIVAVAQSYKDAGFRPDKFLYRSIPEIDGYIKETACGQKGWNNKMFVAPNLMPHQIRITNVRIERLQDISDEDCLREGVVKIERKIAQNHPQSVVSYYPCKYMKECADKVGWGITYSTPREAYAVLIDKVSGKGIWDSNPWVWVYEFELIK